MDRALRQWTWLVTVGILASIVGGCAATAPDGPGACVLHQIDTISLTATDAGTLLVPAEVNGIRTTMAVDTSVGSVMLFQPFARRLRTHLSEHGDMGPPSLDGVETLGSVRLDSLSIGRLQSQDVDAAVVARPDPAMPATIGGVLNPTLIQGIDIEFDLDKHRLRLFAQDHCPGKVVYWPEAPQLAVPMRLDVEARVTLDVMVEGRPVTALLDSGAAQTSMSWAVAKPLGITRNSQRLERVGSVALDGSRRIGALRYLAETVTVGDETLLDVPILVLDSAPDLFAPRPGAFLLLGRDFIHDNRIYLSIKDRTMFFTPYQSGTAAPIQNMAAR